jgi:hypothetical protein
VVVSVLALPARVPVNVAVYVPGVEVWLTVPNDPVLPPPPKLKLKALLFNPVTALPEASSTTIVTVSPVPEASVDEAKLTDDLLALIVPDVT